VGPASAQHQLRRHAAARTKAKRLCEAVCLLQGVTYVHQLTAGSSQRFFALFWNSLPAMEHENSSQCSQQPAICPYPEPHKSSSLPPNPIYLSPILILSFQSTLKAAEWSRSLRFRHKSQYVLHAPPVSPDPPNNIRWAGSFITLFSPLSSYWAPLGPKSPPRHLITEHPQSDLFVSITDQVSHP
jgi:hypothetical protein